MTIASFIAILCLAAVGGLGWYVLRPSAEEAVASLTQVGVTGGNQIVQYDLGYDEAENTVSITPPKESLDQLMRGIGFRQRQRSAYKFMAEALQVAAPGLALMLLWGTPTILVLSGTGAAFFLARIASEAIIKRAIARRADELRATLPLILEQLVVCMGSSLDIGPSIHRIISLAAERGTPSPGITLLTEAYYATKRGFSLAEGLVAVGGASTVPELKHAFLGLAQVSRHGGEVIRQMRELAASVTMQRESEIDSRIKRLEVEAVAPVALVFASFMTSLLVCLFFQLSKIMM